MFCQQCGLPSEVKNQIGCLAYLSVVPRCDRPDFSNISASEVGLLKDSYEHLDEVKFTCETGFTSSRDSLLCIRAMDDGKLVGKWQFPENICEVSFNYQRCIEFLRFPVGDWSNSIICLHITRGNLAILFSRSS